MNIKKKIDEKIKMEGMIFFQKKIFTSFFAAVVAVCFLAGVNFSAEASWSPRDLVDELKGEQMATLLRNGEFPQSNQLYSAYPFPVNWNTGYTTVFVGMRKNGYPILSFAQKMRSHIEIVRHEFHTQGLRGYVFVVTGEHEIAFQNWTSKSAAEAAFSTTAGKAIIADAQSFLSGVLFEQVTESKLLNWLNRLSWN